MVSGGVLKEAVPKVSEFAVLYEPADRRHYTDVKEGDSGRGACAGFDYSTLEVRDADGLEKFFAAMRQQRPDGLLRTGEPLLGC